MKKIVMVFMATVGILASSGLQAQTTMQYLTASSMWAERDLAGDYGYMKFTETSVTEGQMLAGADYKRTMPYYLSDTEEGVFNRSKVGSSATGEYIVMDNPDGAPIVYRIERVTGEYLALSFDSKGKNVPSKTRFRLYPRERVPSPQDIKIFDTYWGDNKLRQISGSPHLKRGALMTNNDYRFIIPDDRHMGHSIALGYYTNGSWSDPAIIGCAQLIKGGTTMESTRQVLDQHEFVDGLSKITAGSKEYVSRFAGLSSNGYYISYPLGDYASMVIFFGGDIGGSMLYIAAFTSDDARFVFSDFVNVRDIDITEGRFRLFMDQGEIYESNGALYWSK